MLQSFAASRLASGVPENSAYLRCIQGVKPLQRFDLLCKVSL